MANEALGPGCGTGSIVIGGAGIIKDGSGRKAFVNMRLRALSLLDRVNVAGVCALGPLSQIFAEFSQLWADGKVLPTPVLCENTSGILSKAPPWNPPIPRESVPPDGKCHLYAQGTIHLRSRLLYN